MKENNKVLLFGNEAIAHGAREAGVYFASAYPGTPSTEILEVFSKFPGIFAKWSPNEKVAMEVGIGSSLTGTRTLVTMKHVGMNVAMDPLMTFTYTGVVGGFVLVCADDPGMHSSQNEQDNRILGKFAKMPILEPSDCQEAHDFTILGYELSERFNTPVMLHETTRIAHAKGLVQLGEWQEPVRGEHIERDYQRFVMMPMFAKARHTFAENRTIQLAKFSNEWEGNALEFNSKDIGIVTSGIAYQYIKELLPDASFLKVGMPFPFPTEKARQLADHVKRIIVVEELEPFIEEELLIAGIKCEGKKYFSREGELNLDIVHQGLYEAGIASKPAKMPTPADVVSRPPVLCAGCPHRGIDMALKKVNADIFGDIGCYTLSALAPLNTMHTCFCMGASIGNAIGVALTQTNAKHPPIAMIGDSTFLHSGLTGLLDMVYSQANATLVIIDNRITAMTGGQENPGSGHDLMGNEAPKVNFEKIISSLGIEKIVNVDTYKFDEAVERVKEAIDFEGPSVIIARQACALFPSKLKPEPYFIEEDCNGCGACLRIGCPAISISGEKTDKGLDKAIIDAGACTGCTLCVQICPIDVIFPVKEAEEIKV
ncbi:MAG: indolepyruvate ferredoxin oxidoreductase subunit alpha [Candidatus Electryonea clarkiae]|nr:indolepyruvate ferredoxin oxidoreductase subunit alpha [Candidatus Electryonea clarkiae]MDP8288911.1 indolepyruvate ferredoxin oxidoreductase subunit alpha [Candidatus Electryonea clarkiae]